ncbi:MAG: urea ABC transporter ATP-binding subunit UrtE [Dietzia sp.]|uniref:Urea ABC transporter ATP-binding subunit UrtE n=1 Tax=Dietzia cercidiphylli TaxID=498199 RepID=A0ABN2I7T0_9ACTN|nr:MULTISPECIES: urea ABC transporter ATP-binding subunit UrtE [Dietzia]MBB1034998.1 urea ABC transporter ATP-binding subunit UrtE [Dietzia sp. CQ4]MBB1038339.1 urea ABC transporter ATP-binding subunit UrtE [Dietzia natronolimnaea]MBB1047107.1 urea ABC transporter ATP-binding subunit UrtE [Dietzia cercidiphylli]MBB1053305.1 urea ABC transporter ATP-binding subunit UrtE [Dietzia sp. B44]MBB1057363.1 urea ABC transporter ATP-binding subunit UrtE [Dietzia sp. B19]
MSALLQMSGVRAGYGGSEVLHGVDLEVPAGGVAAVLGHNGAGKTTLLRAAVGLLPCKAGTITFDGQDITGLKPHGRVALGIGYVPQGQQSFTQLTTAENLRVVADGRKRGKALIDESLDLFPALKELLDRKAGLLSGGQRQQLAIARALITEPRLLVLDEPTEGIQPNVVAEIERIIVDLASRGDLSVLLVEQHVGFSLRASDVFYVVESGRVTHSGASDDTAAHEVTSALAI